jgi:dipicolinate synthase subunit A
MYENKKLAIIGGDARQAHLAAMLAERGFECAVWGIGDGEDIGDGVRCREVESATEDADAIILPLPATKDGVYVNCSECDGETNEKGRVRLFSLIDNAKQPIFGGRFDRAAFLRAQERGVRLVDYFDSETLKIRNAIPTAEGAVEIAMKHLKITIASSRMLVVGYGRIGQLLSHLLSGMGADVTVAARSLRALAAAESMGMRTVRLSPQNAFGGLLSVTEKKRYDAVFNTVPAVLFDKNLLSNMNKDTLLIDLASFPGGVDMEEAKRQGISAIWALSLPGRYAPVTAGRIIGESLIELFESEGII